MVERKKVAILGGGLGALSAAYWLSCTPALRERFEVTVYCRGWRLGGKGASGRNLEQQARIEEHGLHMMMGFYETAFHVIRSCYEAMPRTPDSAFQSWDQAFEPQRQVTLWLKPGRVVSDWTPWNLRFPANEKLPGEAPLSLSLDAGEILSAVWKALRELIHHLLAPLPAELQGQAAGGALEAHLAALRARLPHADAEDAATLAALEAPLRDLQHWLRRELDPLIEAPPPGLDRLSLYKRALLLDLGLAGLIGFVADRVWRGDEAIDALNERDFRDWLRHHGASAAVLDGPLVMCLYDLAFAYRDGDSTSPDHGSAAAGAFLLLILRMAFTYRGAPLWKMKAGMGDVIFTPLFRLLDRDSGPLGTQGVRFEFFNRVRALRCDPEDPGRIARIEIDVQAGPKGARYEPLCRLRLDGGGHWDCWPAAPRWDQLVDGDVLQREQADFEDVSDRHCQWQRCLEAGTDFDAVILAIPPAAASELTQELCTQPAWRNMLAQAHAVATQSVQLWLRPSLAGLGWPYGPTVATCFGDELRAWGEMSQVLAAECWGDAPDRPQSCEYLCGTFPAGQTAGAAAAQQRQAMTARHWLQTYSGHAWPTLRDAFPEAVGSAPAGARDVAGVYYRLNLDPSERYVQSLPGTLRARLAPEQSGFANLFLAGDWTVTSINGGCAEAAFESGLRAACAIAGLSAPPTPQFPTPADGGRSPAR